MVDNCIFAVAGAKGGVGKTTTSINLGAELASAGYATAVVELDLAMANLVDFLDVGIDERTDVTFHDVLSGKATLSEATYEMSEGLSIVPSGTTLDGYAETSLDRFPGLIEQLRDRYEIVLLDTPAGLSRETVRPIQLADEILLISTPRVSAIRNVKNSIELANRVDADVRGLVLTKSGTGASPGAETIADFLELELLGHVPEDDAIPHSQDRGKPVVEYAPNSGAAIAYRKIAGKLVPSERETATGVDSEPTGESEKMASSEPDDASTADSGEQATNVIDEEATAGTDEEPTSRAITGNDTDERIPTNGTGTESPREGSPQEQSTRTQAEASRERNATPNASPDSKPTTDSNPTREHTSDASAVATTETGSDDSDGGSDDSDGESDDSDGESDGGDDGDRSDDGGPTVNETESEADEHVEEASANRTARNGTENTQTIGQRIRSFFIR